jgi:hypothetical protein
MLEARAGQDFSPQRKKSAAPHDPVRMRFDGHAIPRLMLSSALSPKCWEPLMIEIDEISARLTVLETVVKQLITHMAVRDDDPPRWVQTRKTLAMSTIDVEGPRHAALLQDAMADFFDQAELVAEEYGDPRKPGTPRNFAR